MTFADLNFCYTHNLGNMVCFNSVCLLNRFDDDDDDDDMLAGQCTSSTRSCPSALSRTREH